jgi:hypothetical protein
LSLLHIRLPTEIFVVPSLDVVFLEYCKPAKIFFIAGLRVTYALVEPTVLNDRLGFFYASG